LPEVKFFWEEPISETLIAESWEKAYQRKFNLQAWNWRFRQNPFDDKIYSSYAFENNTVICYYAVSPVLVIKPDNTIVKAGLMNMAFTHPDYRDSGLFVAVESSLNNKLMDIGFDFIFAFANNNSHYSQKKYLNWNDIGILTSFTLHSNFKKKISDCTDIVARDIAVDSSLMHSISTFTVCSDKYHIERSSEYLEWRVLKHPINNYEAVGVYTGDILKAVCIYKMFNSDEIDIMEIFIAPQFLAETELLTAKIIRHLLSKGITTINIWSNLFDSEHLYLEKIGFVEEKFSAYLGFIRLADQSISTDISQWHYRFLDSDVY